MSARVPRTCQNIYFDMWIDTLHAEDSLQHTRWTRRRHDLDPSILIRCGRGPAATLLGDVVVLFSYPPALQRKWPRAEVGPWPRPCHGEASTGPLLAAGLRGRPVWAGRPPQWPAAVQGRRPQCARAAGGCAAFTELRSGDGALRTAKGHGRRAGVHLEAAGPRGCAESLR